MTKLRLYQECTTFEKKELWVQILDEKFNIIKNEDFIIVPNNFHLDIIINLIRWFYLMGCPSISL